MYQIVIEPGQSLLAGKQHLIFIPDGALQTIPSHILIGGEPEEWLVRRFAVTVAPSAAAFVARRESSRPLGAALALPGVGNPHFTAFNGIPTRSLRGITSNLRQALAGLPSLPETAVELQRMPGCSRRVKPPSS
jgi:CHAT domain-containing protein